jgi:hypothetical protein
VAKVKEKNHLVGGFSFVALEFVPSWPGPERPVNA